MDRIYDFVPYLLVAALLLLIILATNRLVNLFYSLFFAATFTNKHKQVVFATKILINLIFSVITIYVIGHFNYSNGVGDVLIYLLKVISTILVFYLLYYTTSRFLIEKCYFLFDLSDNKELKNFTTIALKGVIIVSGILSTLSTIGINITALLGGLTIITTAIGFAAKDTLQNLFGSLSLYFENRFKIGDWIKIGTIEGIVEFVGIRSSQIRQFDTSLISVPNDLLADSALINYSRMTARLIAFEVTLSYTTTPEQLNAFYDELSAFMESMEAIVKHDYALPIHIKFSECTTYGFLIIASCYTHSTDSTNFYMAKKKIMIHIADIISRHKIKTLSNHTLVH